MLLFFWRRAIFRFTTHNGDVFTFYQRVSDMWMWNAIQWLIISTTITLIKMVICVRDVEYNGIFIDGTMWWQSKLDDPKENQEIIAIVCKIYRANVEIVCGFVCSNSIVDVNALTDTIAIADVETILYMHAHSNNHSKSESEREIANEMRPIEWKFRHATSVNQLQLMNWKFHLWSHIEKKSCFPSHIHVLMFMRARAIPIPFTYCINNGYLHVFLNAF